MPTPPQNTLCFGDNTPQGWISVLESRLAANHTEQAPAIP